MSKQNRLRRGESRGSLHWTSPSPEKGVSEIRWCLWPCSSPCWFVHTTCITYLKSQSMKLACFRRIFKKELCTALYPPRPAAEGFWKRKTKFLFFTGTVIFLSPIDDEPDICIMKRKIKPLQLKNLTAWPSSKSNIIATDNDGVF